MVQLKKRGKIFIISAPAGTGKTTLASKLIKEFPNMIQSVSFTTRAPRDLEVDGVDYFFISKEQFQKKIQEGNFLEHVELYGFFYGTSKEWVENNVAQGKDVILVIDTQGAKKLIPILNHACYIFIMPPCKITLKERLQGRGTDSLESIETRLKIADSEMGEAHHYQYLITNDKLETAYDVLRSIVIAEKHRL